MRRKKNATEYKNVQQITEDFFICLELNKEGERNIQLVLLPLTGYLWHSAANIGYIGMIGVPCSEKTINDLKFCFSTLVA